MSVKCIGCGSFAINHNCHGRDGRDGELCDVCYWRKRAGELDGFKLPCDVLVKPGMIFGKGVSVSTLLLGLRNRDSYERDLSSLSHEDREDRAKLISEFKRLLDISDNRVGSDDGYQAMEVAKITQQRDELLKVMEDYDRLVRELDVLLNGVDGAAKQASLCDLVAQLKVKGV